MEQKVKIKGFLPAGRQVLGNLGLGAEKDYFLEQLALLLSSGMTITLALSAIKEEIKSKRLKVVIDEITQNIDAGTSISTALEASGIFPAHVVSLIRIGEKSGRLPQNLKVVALDQQKEREFRGKVASAMMYPLFVFSLTLIVGIGIAWFILPRLAQVFSQLKVDLPLITRLLIGLGNFLGQYGTIAMPLVLTVGILLIFFFFVLPKTSFLGQGILFAIAPIRRLLLEVELGRLGYIFGNLLSAGLPIVDALRTLADASTLSRYKKFYAFLAEKIGEGNSFQKSFPLYKNTASLIPVPIQQLIISAELSGGLPETLIKIGEMYESKTETTTKNLTVLLEPVLLVIVWVGVVAVALAVILPLYSLIGSLNKTPSTPPPVVTQAIVEASPSAALVAEKKVEILTTETDFLNVRREPSLTAEILKQAKPGETYLFLKKEEEWYQIEFEDKTTGWVYGQYVKEIE